MSCITNQNTLKYKLQCVPFEKSQKEMAVALKQCIFDPMLVKPKYDWKAVVFFNFQKFVYIFQLFVYNFSKNMSTLKNILALPTWGQICTVSEQQPFVLGK